MRSGNPWLPEVLSMCLLLVSKGHRASRGSLIKCDLVSFVEGQGTRNVDQCGEVGVHSMLPWQILHSILSPKTTSCLGDHGK